MHGAHKKQDTGSPAHRDIRASYHIREYKDDDYEMVVDVFKSGLKESIPDAFYYILKLMRTKVLLWGLPLALYMAFKSIILSTTAVAIILVLSWFGARYISTSYIQRTLKGDMRDIQGHYMQTKGSCFWVAESNGKVIGTVAAEPYQDPGGAGAVELKRFYVRKEYQGQGIGKALYRTFLNFAKQEGYRSVILETTIVQYSGIGFYESMGFKMWRCDFQSSFVLWITNCIILFYRYDFPEGS